MSDLRTPPPAARALRERRLTRMLYLFFLLAGQMGAAAWLCAWAGAPEWVYAILLGVTLLSLIAALRLFMVYLGHVVGCHWSAQSTSASSAPHEKCAGTEHRQHGLTATLPTEEAP